MPSYPGAPGAVVPVASNLSPIALQKGESCYVFGVLSATATQLPVNEGNVAVEEVPAGTASIAVNLQAGSESQPPPMLCIEIHFDSDPGVAEIDVQEADTDADAFYITMSNANYTIVPTRTGNINTRVDLNPTGGKFLRLFVKTLPNDADMWAKITRLA
jgi:hypothetical protein